MSFDEFAVHTLMEITDRPPIVFVRGQGSWLWDHNGKKYLDLWIDGLGKVTQR